MPKKEPIFIIAEAGSNWRAGSPQKDLRSGFALIEAAAAAGADAVKFQTYRAASVYAPNAGTSDYLAKNGIRRSIEEIFKDLEMPYAMIPKLAKHCRRSRIEFMTSAFSSNDFDAVDPWVKRHKIASYEISHSRLLAKAARSHKPVILSTGASTVQDIDWAVRFFKKQGGRGLSLMQCTAKYPSPISALNLRVIPFLQKRYGVPAGLSDHSLDPVIGPVAAAALGAALIEKHFTLDRRLKGPDHAFAITPDELKLMVRSVRHTEQSLGNGQKTLLPEERELSRFARRALQATQNIRRGEKLVETVNFDILRPGKNRQGLHPKNLAIVNGACANRTILAGDGIREGEFTRRRSVG